MIYLASPYSHHDKIMETVRFHMARSFVNEAIRDGFAVFSPIVYAHNNFQLGTDAHSWQQFNDIMLVSSRELWVLCLPGWELSTGVTYEIEFASALRLPVHYFKMDGRPWL